jgi:hypothetical protein
VVTVVWFGSVVLGANVVVVAAIKPD